MGLSQGLDHLSGGAKMDSLESLDVFLVPGINSSSKSQPFHVELQQLGGLHACCVFPLVTDEVTLIWTWKSNFRCTCGGIWPGISMSMELLASEARAVGGRDEANDVGLSIVNHTENPLEKAFLSLPPSTFISIWECLKAFDWHWVVTWVTSFSSEAYVLKWRKPWLKGQRITHNWILILNSQLRYLHWEHWLFFLEKCISDDKKSWLEGG